MAESEKYIYYTWLKWSVKLFELTPLLTPIAFVCILLHYFIELPLYNIVKFGDNSLDKVYIDDPTIKELFVATLLIFVLLLILMPISFTYGLPSRIVDLYKEHKKTKSNTHTIKRACDSGIEVISEHSELGLIKGRVKKHKLK